MIATTTLFIALLAYPVISSRELFRRQDLSGVPACGQTCLITAATDSKIVGSCSITDISCLCNNDKFQSSVQSCALSSCSTQDQLKILTWATATCPTTASKTPASQEPASTAAVPSGDAGELSGLPACGQTCLIDTAGNNEIVGSCSSSDKACLCKNEKYMGAVTTCVASKCSLSDKLTMLKMSSTMCSTSDSDSAAAKQATPAATASPTPQAPSEASSASVTQPIPTASSTPVPTISSQDPLVQLPSNASSVDTYGSANSTTAASAGNAATNVSTSSAPINKTSEETSPATKVSCTGSWILAFALMVATL